MERLQVNILHLTATVAKHTGDNKPGQAALKSAGPRPTMGYESLSD